MIREKLIAQLTTAKAATNLRRAFQAVDLDGGGTIEKDEIKEVLRVKSSLDFSDDLWDRIWVRRTDAAPTCSVTFLLAVAAGLVAVELCNTPGVCANNVAESRRAGVCRLITTWIRRAISTSEPSARV